MAKKAPASTAPTTPAKGKALAVGERAKPATPPSAPARHLDVFPNPAPQRDYVIQFQVPEFTCFCPLTGQPDFAHFTIDCIADELCIELKSLKMYMWSYRNDGAFHEKVTNSILDDMVKAIQPRYLRITPSGTCAAASTPTLLLNTARRAGSQRPRWTCRNTTPKPGCWADRAIRGIFAGFAVHVHERQVLTRRVRQQHVMYCHRIRLTAL
jgi:7-cyano-7-deazaguanine reductase